MAKILALICMIIVCCFSLAQASVPVVPSPAPSCQLIETKAMRINDETIVILPLVQQENIKAYLSQAKIKLGKEYINIHYLDYTGFLNSFHRFNLINHEPISHFTIIYDKIPCDGKCFGKVIFKNKDKLEIIDISYRKTFLRNLNIKINLNALSGNKYQFTEIDNHENNQIFTFVNNEIIRKLPSLGFLNSEETEILYFTDFIRYSSRYSLATLQQKQGKDFKIPAQFIETRPVSVAFKPFNPNSSHMFERWAIDKEKTCIVADLRENNTKRNKGNKSITYFHGLVPENKNQGILIYY